MSVEIRVPSLGESVTEATVARWFKQVGDEVSADEPIVELETDKVTLEFNAPASGTLAEIVVEEGGEVEVGALLGSISEGAGAGRPAATGAAEKPAQKPAAAAEADEATGARGRPGNGALSPAVRKLLEEHGLDATMITPSGPKGNLTKGDVLAAVEARRSEPAAPAENGSAETAADDRRRRHRRRAGPSPCRSRPPRARRRRRGRRRCRPRAGRRRSLPRPGRRRRSPPLPGRRQRRRAPGASARSGSR